MSKHQFGVGNGRVSRSEAKRCDAIARKHGAVFVSPNLPEGPRYWFEAPGKGHPFDAATARAVLRDVGAVRVMGRPVTTGRGQGSAQVVVRLSDEEASRLDKRRGDASRADWLRSRIP